MPGLSVHWSVQGNRRITGRKPHERSSRGTDVPQSTNFTHSGTRWLCIWFDDLYIFTSQVTFQRYSYDDEVQYCWSTCFFVVVRAFCAWSTRRRCVVALFNDQFLHGISWCDSSIKLTCIQVLKRTGCFSTKILMKIPRCVSRATLALTDETALENCMFRHGDACDRDLIVSLLCRVWRAGLWRGQLTDVLLLRLEIQISVSSWLLNTHWISTSFWPPAWTSHQLSSSSILLSSQLILKLLRQSLHACVNGQQALDLWFHGIALLIWAILLRLIPAIVRTAMQIMHSAISASIAHRWLRLHMYVLLLYYVQWYSSNQLLLLFFMYRADVATMRFSTRHLSSILMILVLEFQRRSHCLERPFAMLKCLVLHHDLLSRWKRMRTAKRFSTSLKLEILYRFDLNEMKNVQWKNIDLQPCISITVVLHTSYGIKHNVLLPNASEWWLLLQTVVCQRNGWLEYTCNYSHGASASLCAKTEILVR